MSDNGNTNTSETDAQRLVIRASGNVPDVATLADAFGVDLDEGKILDFNLDIIVGGPNSPDPGSGSTSVRVEEPDLPVHEVADEGASGTDDADADTDADTPDGSESPSGSEPASEAATVGDGGSTSASFGTLAIPANEQPLDAAGQARVGAEPDAEADADAGPDTESGTGPEAEVDGDEYRCPGCDEPFPSWMSLKGHAGNCAEYDADEMSLPPAPREARRVAGRAGAKGGGGGRPTRSESETVRDPTSYQYPQIGEVQTPPPTGRYVPTSNTNLHIVLVSLAWYLEDRDVEWACTHEIAAAPWCPLEKNQCASAMTGLWKHHGCVDRKGRSMLECSAGGSSGFEMAYRLSDHGHDVVEELGTFEWPEGAEPPADHEIADFAVVDTE